MLSHALAYLKKGKSVIPVGKNKRPLIKWEEFQKRLPTEAEVRSWWKMFPEANIGIVTGKVSNILVVDVDKKSGGIETVKGLALGATLTAKTGGGGLHYYYKYQEGVGNKAGIYQGIDIRGEGGYVLAPPSMHESGQPYRWGLTIEAADFPRDVFNVEKVENNWEWLVGGVGEGERNESSAKVAGILLRTFKPEQWETVAWKMLLGWNSANRPPLPEDELRATFESIASREGAKPREEEEEEDVKIVTFKQASDRLEKERCKEFYSTGFDEFDSVLLGGFMSGDLIVVTAPTGQGKTSFAQTLTYNLAKRSTPCLWFSYEVMVSELWRKFENMGVDEKFASYIPLKHPTGKIDWIKEKIDEAIEEYGVKVVFVDHLGFLLPSAKYDSSISNNYSAYLGSICRELKTYALERGVALVLMVHIRKTDKPSIEDIRDSSGIAQESDIVFILSRIKASSTKKSFVADEDFDVYTNETRISIEKNRRTGATRSIKATMENDRFVTGVEGTTLPIL